MDKPSNIAKLTSVALITLMIGMTASFGISEEAQGKSKEGFEEEEDGHESTKSTIILRRRVRYFAFRANL